MRQRKKLYVYAGFLWCVLFAAMSFYWASGGMTGVKSLGGYIYQKALERDPSFMAIVWLTGFIKLCGGVFLLLLLRTWSKTINRILYFLSWVAGLFLFLYGFANFTTLFLSVLGKLSLQIDDFSLKSRLFFWEPFWMLGGILFVLSGYSFKKEGVGGRNLAEKYVGK